ncbi:MAG: APC family permease [Spirochaetaceae bacterium]|nr:APC family permease [Spirochaetaceae bacterium]
MTTKLKKVLGFWPVFGACFGIAISGSTIMLLGNIFGMAGMPIIFSQLIALGVMVLVALAFSELSTMMPVAGGISAYTKEAMGMGPAVTVILLYFIATFSLAVNALVDGEMLNMLVPAFPPLLWAVILVTIYLVFNLLGAKVIGFGQGLFTIIVIVAYILMGVLALSGAGKAEIDMSRLADWSGIRFGSIISFSMIAIWFFVGIEMATPLAEEVKNPQKTLPRAMIAGLCVIFLIQLLIGPAMLAMLSQEELMGYTPHIALAMKLFGDKGLYIILVLQLALEFTTIGGVMFGISRLIFGSARDGMLPKPFAKLHPKFQTPWVALFTIYAAVLVAMFIGAPFILLSIASIIFFIIYMVVFVDLVILRRKMADTKRSFYAGGPFKLPVLSIIGFILILGILIGNAMDDPMIISIGLPVAGGCFLLSMIWSYFYKKQQNKKDV